MLRKPISFGQRVAGLGTILTGLFALYYCLTFVRSLWDTPQRNLGIGVTIASLLMVFGGVIIGFPDKLPRNLVAMFMLMLGLLSMLIGVLISLRCLYNLLFEQQVVLLGSRFAMSAAMVTVGYGFASKAIAQLRNRDVEV